MAETAELLNGNMTRASKFNEVGTSGIEAWSGFVQKAYHTELFWPTCYPLFNRIRRSDPEIGGIVRPAYTTLVNDVSLDVELPDDPSDDDKRFQDFTRETLDDIDGGQGQLLSTIASYAPFMGWQWFDVPLAKRVKGWKPPNDTSGWRSNYNDGLIGIRGFYHRDHSSFDSWDMDDNTGRVMGMYQYDMPNPKVRLPLERSLHLTFGDPTSPEGLSPLEAVWRLERMKFGLEVVQGKGYEHTAGYAAFKIFQSLDDETRSLINKAARALLTAQEGNYITEIAEKFEARIIDTPFQAAPAILEAIRYYGILKLQVYNMQWVAMASTTNSGAFSAVQDSSTMFINSFNAMMSGFADQIDRQVGERLLRLNESSFPNITRRPRIVATPIEKSIPLNELSSFVKDLVQVMPLGEDDIIAIRRKSGFLSEALPEVDNEPFLQGGDEIEDATLEAGSDMAELTQPNLFDDSAKELAGSVADSTSDEIATLYREWLDELAPELENVEDDTRRREIILAASLVLSGRVHSMLTARMAQLAIDLQLDAEQLAALQRETSSTLEYFDAVSIPILVNSMIGYSNDSERSFEDSFKRKARDYALVGGVIWAGYVAAKLANQPANQMARWAGPNDANTCGPCSTQMNLGVRPLSQIPLPGIGVCRGLSNCRHDIVLVNGSN